MSPLENLDRRYHDDNEFRIMTDMLMGVMLKLEMTPQQVKEAAMYAAYRVEMTRAPSPLVIARARIDASLNDPGGRGLRDSLLGYADALENEAKGRKF